MTSRPPHHGMLQEGASNIPSLWSTSWSSAIWGRLLRPVCYKVAASEDDVRRVAPFLLLCKFVFLVRLLIKVLIVVKLFLLVDIHDVSSALKWSVNGSTMR